MTTALRLGPGDHGRPMTYDEFIAGDYEGGYRYELIDGRLYVSPEANFSHDRSGMYVFHRLDRYREQHPAALNCLSLHARVFVPRRRRVTAPEPDIAAYRNIPLDRQWTIDWRDVSPFLVVEILGGGDDAKDLVRNVDLYFRVPSIEEYWIWDIRHDPARPTLRVRRRQPKEWAVLDFAADAVYTTDLLPGFELPVTPTEV